MVFCGRLTGPYAAKEIRQLGSKGLRWVITPKNDFSGDRARVGRPYMIYPVKLMACAIGERFGMRGGDEGAGIEAFVPTKMRMNVIHQGYHHSGRRYNANPQSMRAALKSSPRPRGLSGGGIGGYV